MVTDSLILLCLLALLYLMALCPAKDKKGRMEAFRGRSFAHRGLHSQHSNIPENSLEAIEVAAHHGYGVELDLRLTADGQPVVFHDEALSRLCGIPRTVEELPADQVKKLRIASTEQFIPTLREVLDKVQGKVPLIVDLKPGKHNRKALCQVVARELEAYNGPVCISSFDPLALNWFALHAKQYLRMQLVTGMRNQPVNALTRYLRQNLISDLVSRPHIIAYEHEFTANFSFRLCCNKLNAVACSWTVTNQTTFENATKYAGMVIFERFFPKPRYDAGRIVNGRLSRGD